MWALRVGAREGLSHGHHRLHVRLFVLACQVCVKCDFVRFIKVEVSSWVLRHRRFCNGLRGEHPAVCVRRESGGMEPSVPSAS